MSCEIIAHICGSPGSGKSWLGDLIAKKLKGRVRVIDLDDVRVEMGEDPEYTETIQKFIDGKVSDSRMKEVYSRLFKGGLREKCAMARKPLVIVGVLDIIIKGKPYVPNMDEFDIGLTLFLDVPFNRLAKQWISREVNSVCKDKRKAISDLIKGARRVEISIETVATNYKLDWEEYVKRLDYEPVDWKKALKMVVDEFWRSGSSSSLSRSGGSQRRATQGEISRKSKK